MGIFSKIFGTAERRDPCADLNVAVPALEIENAYTPEALDLGWYWSENKTEYQMAKISEKDRTTHFYVIGATGSGKTKFLEFLIRQDIDKEHGFGVIDPHGDLVDDIKGYLAFQSKRHNKDIAERVVVIDPTDPEYTVTFNPLERLPNLPIAEQVNELVSAFRKIWSDSWGVRMEDLLRNSLIALGEAELTLADLPIFLTKRGYREVVLQSVRQPLTRNYFERFDAMTDRGQAPWIEPVMNKINSFFADERIRQMFASSTKSSFNLREVMDQKKILLIKLDKGRLKDSADLLGSLLMAKIQMAAFSRTYIPQSKRTAFYLYVDEFQNYATESFAVILSEARKYGLSLIMAHQTLAQIPIELRSLILGNAGIQVYFRVNRQDASILAKEAFEYSGFEVKTVSSHRPVFWSYSEEWERKINDLQSLPPRACYAKHKIEGGIIPFHTADIDPAWQLLGIQEDALPQYLKKVPLGRKYLISRSELLEVAAKRRIGVEEKIIPTPKPAVAEVIPIKKEEPILSKKERKTRLDIPVFEGQGGSQHRYLQSLIKRMAEEKGFRAVIEQPTPDGAGFVDVSLERNGERIACEISLTTTDDHEFNNVEKCLKAGYGRVVLCSPDKKVLERLKVHFIQKLADTDKDKVLFFQPEELIFFLEQEAASSGNKEDRVKGYKVKVQYQPVKDADKKMKRDAVGQVIVKALKRLKTQN